MQKRVADAFLGRLERLPQPSPPRLGLAPPPGSELCEVAGIWDISSLRGYEMERLVESKQVGRFAYKRTAFQSQVLAKEMTYGVADFPSESGSLGSVLYVFHGGNGDDSQTIQTGILELLSPAAIRRFEVEGVRVVMPWVEGSFLRVHALDPKRSYHDYFHKEILPRAEAGLHVTEKTRRICGFSAGGMGALAAFLRTPSLFAGVGAHFPIFPTYDYTVPSDVEAYMRRTGTDPGPVDIAGQCFKAVFDSAQECLDQSPLTLLAGVSASAFDGRRVFVDVGSKDEYGLHEGCERFHQALASRGIAHHFEIVPEGRHDLSFLQSRFPKMIDYLFSIAEATS